MTLVDFILARIAEDEEVARSWTSPDFLSPDPDLWRDKAERYLHRCKELRRIVEDRPAVRADSATDDAALVQWEKTCRHIASNWPHHPDYRQEWRA